MLRREQLRDVLAVLVDELADPEEELGAARQRQRAPGGERLLRGRDRLVDLLDRREVDLARLLAGRRVEDGAVAARRPLDGLPPIQWEIRCDSPRTAASGACASCVIFPPCSLR